jgi:hypothetical protein
LDKFKEAIINMLRSIGIEFDQNYTAAHAISDIFELIERNNLKVDENPYETMWNETMNFDQGQMPPDWFNENDSTPPEVSFLPSSDFINSLQKEC